MANISNPNPIPDPNIGADLVLPAPLELRNLTQLLRDNPGGVEACWYVDVADVLSVPDLSGPVVTGDVVLRPGAYWYQLVASLSTLRFSYAGKSDRHGDYFQPRLRGALAKASAALATGLEAMSERRFLVLHRDGNGLVWLSGEPDSPLRWQESYDAGSNTERNGYDFSFSGETEHRPRLYTGNWNVSGAGLDEALQLVAGAGVVEIRDRRGALLATVAAGRTVVLRSGFRVSFSII